MRTVVSGEMDLFRVGEAILQSNSNSSTRQEMMRQGRDKRGKDDQFDKMLKTELKGLSIA